MDRREALKLLKGGTEGISEWIRRRDAGEGIPSLFRANLGGANLLDANLRDADLRIANLDDANLGGANFTDADLRARGPRRC